MCKYLIKLKFVQTSNLLQYKLIMGNAISNAQDAVVDYAENIVNKTIEIYQVYFDPNINEQNNVHNNTSDTGMTVETTAAACLV